nr:MAG TPA: hypothetical protein [Caudoviricetes sp.]DAR73750.1 MAG TPA: hypothetical protein [Caudoviricetes sp.]
MSGSDMSKLMIRIVLGCYTLFMLLLMLSLCKTYKAVELPLSPLDTYGLITGGHILGMMAITFLALISLQMISLRDK